jgi:glycosyltransferase involved in cell wall biosynthesis
MGPVQFNDGIGRQTIGLIDCLKDIHTIQYIKHDGVDPKDLPHTVKRIIRSKYKATPNVLIFESPLLYPLTTKFPRFPNASIKFAYSMLESTKIPQNWVKLLNTHFDAVLVPDPFLVDVYINSGVKTPIFVIPLGMYLAPFLEKAELRTRPVDRPFTFGNLSSFVERKNQLSVIQAFGKAFGNQPNFQLILNGRASEADYFVLLQEEKQRLGLTNVTITNIPLDWQHYIAEFAALDCYISVSKGEGFSLQPREALALGIPSIVTDNTGQSTICKSGYVYSLPSEKRIPAFYRIFDGWYDDLGEHFECSTDDLAAAMLEVYTNYEKHAVQAFEGRSWVKNYEYENLQRAYATIVKPSSVVLAQFNVIENGVLYTNSSALYDKYKALLDKESFPRNMINSLIVSLGQ